MKNLFIILAFTAFSNCFSNESSDLLRNVMPSKFEEILKKAESKYPDNYGLQVYFIENECDDYFQMVNNKFQLMLSKEKQSKESTK